MRMLSPHVLLKSYVTHLRPAVLPGPYGLRARGRRGLLGSKNCYSLPEGVKVAIDKAEKLAVCHNDIFTN